MNAEAAQPLSSSQQRYEIVCNKSRCWSLVDDCMLWNVQEGEGLVWERVEQTWSDELKLKKDDSSWII